MKTDILHLEATKMFPFRVQYFRTLFSSFSRCYTVPSAEYKIDASLHLEVARDDRQHQQLFDFVYEETFPRESVRKVMGIGHGVFSLIDKIPTFLNQEVSLMITDTKSNKVIGCAINRVVTAGKPENLLNSYNPGVKAVTTFLKRLKKNHNNFHQQHMKNGIEIFYLGVKEQYCRQGLARYLAQKSTILACKKELDFIQSFSFCSESSKLFESLNFETYNEIYLADHLIEGTPAFPQARPKVDYGRFVVKML